MKDTTLLNGILNSKTSYWQHQLSDLPYLDSNQQYNYNMQSAQPTFVISDRIPFVNISTSSSCDICKSHK